MVDNQTTLKKKRNNKRKARKIALLFLLTGITAVLLIVETYAWFIGTASVETNTFEIGVESGDSLELSLDGTNWSTSLDLSKDSIMGTAGDGANKAYTGHTNIWPSDTTGLVPLSTDGASDPAANGRLKLYGKSSLTGTGGGYRLISTRIDNYSSAGTGALVSEQNGYVAFDMFIRNGTGVDYIEEYNQLDDEALYLTTSSSVKAGAAGSPSYGLENSVRLAFVQIGRVPSATAVAGDITSISCTASESPAAEGVTNTSLCNVTDTTIWEPNHAAHDERLITYFNKVCKKKTVTPGTPEGTPATISYADACEALTASSAVNTYVVNSNITSADQVDIYDGINGATSTKLTAVDTFTDEEKAKEGADRPAFMYIAPNSVTKVRVYIYLEGQDVDNYDLASLGNSIKINFGFTKDQWDLAEDLETA